MSRTAETALDRCCRRCRHPLWLHLPGCVATYPQGPIRPGPTDFTPCTCEGPQ